ncbi:MAG: sigma-54 dependent transcriptional regulator [Thermodesulfovibrionales bacterium]|nr:sigma-54 dependent transcriptional regulator [Thermodesulfovibrionales bacterium]
MPYKILIVEDDELLCISLKRLFQKEAYDVTAVYSAESALIALNNEPFDLIITDIVLPGIDGIELLSRVKEKYPDTIVIVMTSYATIETAIRAFRLGSYDYIIKPVIHEELKLLVRKALTQIALADSDSKTKKLSSQIKYDYSNIVGKHPFIKTIIQEIKMIANSRSNVLILGETGTGKELIARAIHYNSDRALFPFIAINCGAIPEHLLESELFGHVKGAFTGAIHSKKGLFEEANRGTIFLDEIADLNLHLQVKLLRVLDDREIRPIGSLQSKKIDVRIIAATNIDLHSAVKEGKFREDLYYRLKVITLKLPPLRERGGDIELLAKHFLEKFSKELDKPVKTISEEALSILKKYPWPGNIRELQNIIERAVLLCETNTIEAKHLPDEIKNLEEDIIEETSLPLSIEEFTKRMILKYQSKYSEQELASMLGITRKALWEKRKRWGILKK